MQWQSYKAEHQPKPNSKDSARHGKGLNSYRQFSPKLYGARTANTQNTMQCTVTDIATITAKRKSCRITITAVMAKGEPMDRQDFMDIVYSELHSDGDNNRANRIIDAADEYAESAQLGTNLAEVGTDTISRKQAIGALKEHRANYCDNTPGTFAKLSYAEKSRVDELDTAIATLINLPPAQPELCEDAVSRKDCLKALSNMMDTDGFRNGWAVSRANVEGMIKSMPPVTPKQPDLSEAYANAVFTWLMSYQIQSAQLKGRYTPYEVIGWVLNDWRKEHDAERDT